jgi:hypothetical protein
MAFRCWLAGFVNLSALFGEPTKTAPGPRPRRWEDAKHFKETRSCSFLQLGQQFRLNPSHFVYQITLHNSALYARQIAQTACTSPATGPSLTVVKQRNSKRRSRAGLERRGARGAKNRPSPTASTLSACHAYKSLESVFDRDHRTAAPVRACTTTVTATGSR